MYEELTPHLIWNKEKGNSFVSPDDLRKDLESELRLDSNDIRSYAWFHGKIPRDLSEQLLRNDGDFLIRESISSAGEHVLTMKWGTIMHFKINKITLQQSATYSKPQYAFEREGFDSIPALIMYHKGNNIPISEQTGAIVQTPINRDLPLSFSDVKYASIRRGVKKSGNESSSRKQNSSFEINNHQAVSSSHTPTGGFVLMQGDHPISPNHANNSASSRTTFTSEGKNRPNPFPLHIQEDNPHQSLRNNLKTIPSTSEEQRQLNQDVGQNSLLSGQQSSRDHVPPKPSRVASFRRPIIRHNSSRESKNSAAIKKNLNEVQPRYSSSSTIQEMSSSSAATSSVTSPYHKSSGSVMRDRRSMFNPFHHRSSLLEDQNKPVDGDAMLEVKKILLGTDSFKLARHMTFIDCEVCKISDLGLEDIFLSKGEQFRIDLLERYQSLSFWVAVCILRGGSTKEEQIKILNVFIMIANELVHSLGNIYGFSSIMHGLICPQIRGLDDLWAGLQQQYTNNAVTMENKLIPLMRLLDEGKGRINTTSTCIPHVLPLLRFFENPLDEIPHSQPSSRASDRKQLSASEGNMLGSVATSKSKSNSWWENLPDDSFDSLMAQLSLARTILSSLQDFKTKSSEKFKDFEKKTLILEIFDTEFHLRLLWGHKGSESPQKERHEKFDKLITLMAKRLST